MKIFLWNLILRNGREKVIMLQLRDRSELIKKINAKQNGRLLKSKNTLNEVLKEKEMSTG